MVKDLTDADFSQEVEQSHLPYLVSFWAIWATPCIEMNQAIESVSRKFEGKIMVGKVNVDNEIRIANECNIQNIPCFLIFRQGAEVERIVGAIPKSIIVKTIKKYVDQKPKTRKE